MDTDQGFILHGLRDWMTQDMIARLISHTNPQPPPSKIIFTAEVVTINRLAWLPYTLVISILKTVTKYALHLHQIHEITHCQSIYKFITIINRTITSYFSQSYCAVVCMCEPRTSEILVYFRHLLEQLTLSRTDTEQGTELVIVFT